MTDTVNVPHELFSTLIWAAEKSGLCSSREIASGQALLAADQPAGDEVEVVAFLMRPDFYEPYVSMSRDRCDGTTEPLMTVRQHEAVLAAALAAK